MEIKYAMLTFDILNIFIRHDRCNKLFLFGKKKKSKKQERYIGISTGKSIEQY